MAVEDTYSDDSDLLLGDITFGQDLRDRFRTVAKREIDVALGFLYVIPLNPALATDGHIALLLARCEALIASGRCIMDRSAGGEDTNLQAYGLSLLQEGQGILQMILNGQIDLTGQDKVDSQKTSGNAPSISQGDQYSGVDAFYDWLNINPTTPPAVAGSAPIWQPGFSV